MKLYHWKAYANTLTGLASADIEQIFVSETAADWEDDIEAGGIYLLSRRWRIDPKQLYGCSENKIRQP